MGLASALPVTTWAGAQWVFHSVCVNYSENRLCRLSQDHSGKQTSLVRETQSMQNLLQQLTLVDFRVGRQRALGLQERRSGIDLA